MREKTGVAEARSRIIEEKFAGRDSFTVDELEPVLGVKKTTLHWMVWDLARKGYIHKLGKGLYTLESKNRTSPTILSVLGIEVHKILMDTPYEFFVSGIDILLPFMQHVPEFYPVLLYGDKGNNDEISRLLIKNDIVAASSRDINRLRFVDQAPSLKGLAFLYPTNEFRYAHNGVASFEKAFVDMYFEATRRQYPLAIQELVRIYRNMKRRIPLDTNRLIKIASQRSIQYDIRYIVDKDRISEKALEFMKILQRQEEEE